MAASMDIRLEGQLAGKYVRALESAYNPERFDQMLLVHLSRQRSTYSLANDLITRFFNVLETANREGWTADLVAASLDANPGNPQLLRFARDLGLDPVPPAQADNLQKVITAQSAFLDAELYLAALAARVAWVCQVVVPQGGGTGILVGPDLVLTNHHVIGQVLAGDISATKVDCVFDYKKLSDGRQISPGRRVALAPNWHVASQPHSTEDTKRAGGRPVAEALDYALIRLAAPVGEEPKGPMGASDAAGQPRSWLRLSALDPRLADNSPLLVLQHPLMPGRLHQEPVQIAVGSVLRSPFPDLRVRHNARTLGGSSGSPCFNANLEMVALHHAGDPVTAWERPEWNQAIPVHRIVADLDGRGIKPPL
jgi:trypsin-like peptidase/effector-associated domain 1 (EAD1)-containing protein